MSMKITRRGFIGTCGAIGASAAALGVGTPLRAQGRPPGWKGLLRVKKVASVCEMCFWRCGILASVAGGRVLRVEGNPDHPMTKGRLCARGNAGVALLYDRDRLKYPLMRTGKRGEGQFKRVSWDEALDFLADKLKSIKKAHGAESVAFFPHGVSAGFFHTLMKAYGTPNSAEPAFAQCRGPREVGYALTFGRGVGSPEPVDLESSKLMVFIGTHIGENVFTSQVTAFAEGLAKGAKLLVVDPRFSTAAEKADWWLPLRPGTDLALLLAWMNVLIAENLYDQDYIRKYANGFDKLAAHVKAFTPEWAEQITQIPADRIRETARAMGKAKPAVALHPGRHATWYGDDTQRSRAMAILTALLGAWGRKGGILMPTASPKGSFDLPDFPEPARPRADGAGTKYPLASEDLGVTNGLVEATLAGKPYPIKAWIVYGQNSLQSIPQPERTKQAIESLDLMVAVDVMPTDHVLWADLVLPEATYLERYDPPAVSESANPPFVSVRFPAIQPLYESKPGWWIAKELARRLGLEAFFPWKTPEEHFATLVEPMDLNPEELMVRGAMPFEGRPYLEDRIAAGDTLFETESGKIELYSAKLKELGFDPLPVYTPVDAAPDGFLRLLYGRAPVHSFARSENNELLAGLMPENELWIQTAVAARLGLKDRQRVVLENQDGIRSLPVRLKVTEGIHPECVYMVHGFGQRSKMLSRAGGRGASDTDLMSRVKIDPIMGGTGMRVNFVKPLALGS